MNRPRHLSHFIAIKGVQDFVGRIDAITQSYFYPINDATLYWRISTITQTYFLVWA
jgi:hypothetical protein